MYDCYMIIGHKEISHHLAKFVFVIILSLLLSVIQLEMLKCAQTINSSIIHMDICTVRSVSRGMF